MKKKGSISYKISPGVNLKSREAYNYYKQNITKKRDKIKNFKDWLKVVDALWKETSDNIKTAQSGVFIDKLGYFAVWLSPYKKKDIVVHHTKGKKFTYNDHTDNRAAHISLFTELGRGGSMNYFTMDRGFSQDITRTISRRLRQGAKYFLRYSLVKQIIKGR